MFITETQHWVLHSYYSEQEYTTTSCTELKCDACPSTLHIPHVTCHGQSHVHMTITLGTIITASPRWRDDLMDLNGEWSPSFVSKYERESARVLVSYCMHLCACPANYDEPGSTPHRRVCALAAVSCLRGAVDQNVKMPWQEFSNSLSAIFSPSPPPSFPVSCCTFISSSSAQYLAPNLPKHWSFDT